MHVFDTRDTYYVALRLQRCAYVAVSCERDITVVSLAFVFILAFVLGLASCVSLAFTKFQIIMAPQPKNPSKKRGKSLRDKGTGTLADPEATVENLSTRLENQAAKRRRLPNPELTDSQSSLSSIEDPPSQVLKNPESLPKDLIQEMRSDIRDLRKQREQQSEEIRQLKAKYAAAPTLDYQWKKEGNRCQYEVIQKLMVHSQQLRMIYDSYKNSAGEAQLDALDATLKERVKLLRIADSSQYGWATVQEYENNPVAHDEEDDRKLKRAEKSAQEKAAQKAAERKTRQGRFGNFSNQGYQATDGEKDEASNTYKAFGGFKSTHPYRNSTVVGEKLPPKRSINNDVCFSCGSRGHWANNCPERKQQSEK